MGPGLARRKEVDNLSVFALTKTAIVVWSGSCFMALSRQAALSLSISLTMLVLELLSVLPSPSPAVSKFRMVGTSSPR